MTRVASPRTAALVAIVVSISSLLPSTFAIADSGFSDIDEAGTHRPAVVNLAEQGILVGTECQPGRFCPKDPLPRWVMAVWLIRVLEGTTPPQVNSTRFTDFDFSQWWGPYVERLAELGITVGCHTKPARYCPHEPVTRGQMASFLTRAFELEAAPPFGFIDIEETYHQKNIDALAAAGITVGCHTNPARYCPGNDVTRGQMATFLTRAQQAIDLDPDHPTPDSGNPPLSVQLSTTAPTGSKSFQVEVRFSRPVNGFTVGDMVVFNGQVAGVSGSGPTYQTTVTRSSEGALVMWIPAGAARDDAGTPNSRSELLVSPSNAFLSGVGFDTWDRDRVVAAYRSEFGREEPDQGFTGEVLSCRAGTTSQTYRDSIVQRINWYRQMAGLHTVTERQEFSAAAQEAALIMAAERRLSHYPGSDWSCYTSTGARAASQSNLGTSQGVDAIDSYMRDGGQSNYPVGHRRWILDPRLDEIGTGDVPYGNYGWATNALHVASAFWGLPSDVRDARGVVAWPPPGYVPAEAVWGRWSLQVDRSEDPDLSSATVSVTSQYGPVSTRVIDRNNNYLVWAVFGDLDQSYPFEAPPQDTCYNITIDNVRVGGSSQTSLQYTTCLLGLAEETAEDLDWLPSSYIVWSPHSGQIAYTKSHTSWTINPDGTNQQISWLHAYSDLLRGRAVFRTTQGLLTADGANLQLLRTSQFPYEPVVWSPDGTKIYYGTWEPGIWTIDADGRNEQKLTTTDAWDLVWSPDGTRIVFDLRDEIWVMDADGTNQQQLTTPNFTRFPSWSPDSSKVAYSQRGIWTVDADGSNRRQLTDKGNQAAWSPDGTRIVFVREDGIWVMDADGTNQQQLTRSHINYRPPVWSPDSTRIVFVREDGIWVMDADGTNQQQLTR